jgi:metal-sulfur cluster biosynthetic enzyme
MFCTKLLLVWEPAWNPDMMTEEGRKELYSA